MTSPGLEIRHYPDTDTLEIDRPRLRTQFRTGGAVGGHQQIKLLASNDRSQIVLGRQLAYVVRQAMQSKHRWVRR